MLLKGTVAFTGKLASMKRADAFALVRKQGGKPREGVTKQTNLLVVGELGWPLIEDGRPSNSLAQAQSYGIPVASERQFLEWTGKAPSEQQTKTYSAEQLAGLSKLPPEVIEQLRIFGLIAEENGNYGFRDLAAARQIAGLLKAGVALSVVTRSLCEIRKWLPDAHLANVRLFPESSDRILVEQLRGHTDKTGQFVLPVKAEGDDPDMLFGQAQELEEEGDLDAAEQLYRRVMASDPEDAAAPFNIANILRSKGKRTEAEAMYRRAIKVDPGFGDAWFNLADLLDDQGRTLDAVPCLESALKANPDYADAVFNLALLLQKLERLPEAAKCWKRYLELDNQSVWAGRARRAMKFCEMKIAGAL